MDKGFTDGKRRIVLLGCGSRDWEDYDTLHWVFEEIAEFAHIVTVVHGGADGADEMVKMWADSRDIAQAVIRPDYEAHGSRAPLVRNELMLHEYRPDLVVAFKRELDATLTRGGTEHTIRKALAASWRPEVRIIRG